jgi:hypothetical protein
VLSTPKSFHPFTKIYYGSYYTSSSTITLIKTLSLLSYASGALSLLTSFPALVTGGAEAYAMIQSRGLDFNNLDPVVKTTLTHAGLMDVSLLVVFLSWASKRWNVDFVPKAGNAIVASLVLAAVGYGSYLGGGLVYEKGVGVQRMGEGRVETQKMLAKSGYRALDHGNVKDMEGKVDKVTTTLDKVLTSQ